MLAMDILSRYSCSTCVVILYCCVDWQDDEVLFTYCKHPNITKYVEAIIGPDIKSVHTMVRAATHTHGHIACASNQDVQLCNMSCWLTDNIMSMCSSYAVTSVDQQAP